MDSQQLRDLKQRLDDARKRGDNEEVERIMKSEEFKEVRETVLDVWGKISTSLLVVINRLAQKIRSAALQIINLSGQKTEHQKYITRMSYKKSKSQQKNWSKWKKRKKKR